MSSEVVDRDVEKMKMFSVTVMEGNRMSADVLNTSLK